MKTWKRLVSGLFALALLVSLSCAALAAEPKGAAEPKETEVRSGTGTPCACP